MHFIKCVSFDDTYFHVFDIIFVTTVQINDVKNCVDKSILYTFLSLLGTIKSFVKKIGWINNFISALQFEILWMSNTCLRSALVKSAE